MSDDVVTPFVRDPDKRALARNLMASIDRVDLSRCAPDEALGEPVGGSLAALPAPVPANTSGVARYPSSRVLALHQARNLAADMLRVIEAQLAEVERNGE